MTRNPSLTKQTDRAFTSINAAALGAELAALIKNRDGGDPRLRNDILNHLTRLLHHERARIEAQLRADGSGLGCARRLSQLQDTIITALFEFAVQYVYQAQNPSVSEHIAIVAVGGYGRATMAPHSDVDLLFLLPHKQTAWCESVIEFILYMLWDLRLNVGQAVRNIDECIRAATRDMTIRTSVLDARLVWGERALFDELTRRLDGEVFSESGAEFVEAKLAERDTRHLREGESRYLVEPNIKNSKGGLRDLQSLFWITKYFYRFTRPAELVVKKVFSRAELRRFETCEDFLWRVRCHLHFYRGRAVERLDFETQQALAERLGFDEQDHLKAAERFMKQYFLIAKDVGDLTRIVCAGLEMRHVKKAPMLDRFLTRIRRRTRLSGQKDFHVQNGRLAVADAHAFERDPVNLVRIFHIAAKGNLALHPDTLRLMRHSLQLIDTPLRNNPDANALFMDILAHSRSPEQVLRLMNETGVLGRFVPAFGHIVALMQFSMYHHYTVDEHLLRAIGFLARIAEGKLAADHPLSHEIFPKISRQNRRALFVAVFLHDIAKGRGEDHAIAGARVARDLCPRLGLSPSETGTVVWLVEHHLLMSTIAQTRDLSDAQTIIDFAGTVRSLERLKLLLILTVVDIRAVGPGTWTGWKGELLRTLYYETEPVLSGGYSVLTRGERIESARQALAARLHDWPKAARDRHLRAHQDAYWIKTDPQRQFRNANLMRRARKERARLVCDVEPRAFEEITAITLYAPDSPRLLCAIAGACTLAGANIADASVFTTRRGWALDTISVSRGSNSDADERARAARIVRTIERILAGEINPAETLKKKTTENARLKAFTRQTEVIVNNSWSQAYTVIETHGLDRTGLLYDLTSALSDLKLNIASAHISTYGEHAVDVFYVLDLTGNKITHASKRAAIRRRLSAAIEQR